jgi:molybdopterin molybdotransferase
MLSLEEARAFVLAACAAVDGIERVTPAEALGRVLAADVVAGVDLPPWDNSAMDGYAVRAEDVAGATEEAPARLVVTGEVAAGGAGIGAAAAVGPGEAIRIATGAPVPPGTAAVVPVEDTTPVAADGRAGARGRDATGPLPAAVLVHVAAPTGANVRARAGDIAAGTTLLRAGIAIGASGVALAAAANVADLPVRRRPRVAVISTGDELRPAGSDLGPAGIPDSNGPALVALARAAGAEARHLGIAPDRFGPMLALLRRAVARADVVIVSGGVSVGPYDVVRLAFEAVGEVNLWRVAIQPGKPFAFGTAERPRAGASPGSPEDADANAAAHAQAGAEAGAGSKMGAGANPRVLLFGLPGNPVSSFVTFELFVRPALRSLAGRADADLLRPVDRAVLEDPVSKGAGRRSFQRVVAVRDAATGAPLRDAEGRVRVRLAGGQGSHVISALAAADGLAVVPESVTSLPAGAGVDLWWLDQA